MRPSISALLLGVAGCGPTVLTAGGQGVRVLKADPPEACQELGPVDGRGAQARIVMRNSAAKADANYVKLEFLGDTYQKGTAFRCPPPDGSPAGRLAAPFCQPRADGGAEPGCD
jgi:hypothetical protein